MTKFIFLYIFGMAYTGFRLYQHNKNDLWEFYFFKDEMKKLILAILFWPCVWIMSIIHQLKQ